jgi:AbrB family looped-hinge helix DNA binding protein
MLTTLREDSQVTIPKELVKKLNLTEGDALEFFEKDGAIFIAPVVIYPEKYLKELEAEAKTAQTDLANGKLSVYDTVADLMLAMEER